MSESDITQRLRALETREAIRELKAEYLAACDAKDPRRMRACFADGTVRIDYGAVGRFERADDLVAVFERIGCHPHMIEMHQGVNPHIELLNDNQARGHWALYYQLIDTREKRLTQLAGYYDDEYARGADGDWKISATRSVITSTLVLALGESAVSAVAAGRPAA